MKDDNVGVTVLKKEFFRAIVIYLGGSGEELMKEIQKSKKIQDKVREKVERKEKDWKEKDGIIAWEGQIYVTKDKDLRDGSNGHTNYMAKQRPRDMMHFHDTPA